MPAFRGPTPARSLPLGPYRSCIRIHADTLHRRQVDHQAAVISAVAPRAMAALANREPKRMRPGKTHGLLHVRHAGAPRDERRAAIDVPIPDMPRALVRGVIIHDQIAAQGASEFRNLLVV